MCSIGGTLTRTGCMPQMLSRITKYGKVRGRDSFGLVKAAKMKSGNNVEIKLLDTEEAILSTTNFSTDTCGGWIITNFRAEPTTEFVANKKLTDVQPFRYENWVVAHNGTIANDKELIKEYDLKMDTKIDSAIIPQLLYKRFGTSEYYEASEVIEYLNCTLKGSYSLAIGNLTNPLSIILMCNYKPIYVAKDSHSNWGFSSLKEAFDLNKYAVQKISPYSGVELVAGYNTFNTFDLLYRKPLKQQKALVVCSGGLDSTVVATHAKRTYDKIKLLHFAYDCRAQRKELEAIKNIAKALKCDYKIIETDFWKSTAKGSRLTDPNAKIAQGEEGIEIAKEWCYARNLVFLSMATAYAESINYDAILLGNNMEEAGAFSDNDPEFIRKFNELLPNAVAEGKSIYVAEPVGNYVKHEIVKLGLELGAPIEHSWSCYENYDQPCNNCGPCNLKRKAFEMNGYELSEDQKQWRVK
jgi:7-cyano-7-deazaguanine synthase